MWGAILLSGGGYSGITVTSVSPCICPFVCLSLTMCKINCTKVKLEGQGHWWGNELICSKYSNPVIFEQIDWGDLNGGSEANQGAEIDFDISGITIESGGTDESKVTNIYRLLLIYMDYSV